MVISFFLFLFFTIQFSDLNYRILSKEKASILFEWLSCLNRSKDSKNKNKHDPKIVKTKKKTKTNIASANLAKASEDYSKQRLYKVFKAIGKKNTSQFLSVILGYTPEMHHPSRIPKE